jgi:hypothetical protein
MDERELRAMAEHYKRIASLVTDEDISKALLELAAKYEAIAKNLRIEPLDRREVLRGWADGTAGKRDGPCPPPHSMRERFVFRERFPLPYPANESMPAYRIYWFDQDGHVTEADYLVADTDDDVRASTASYLRMASAVEVGTWRVAS